MASAIEDVSSLPGETVHDQEGRKIGEVKEIYAVGDDTPMWVTVEMSTGIGRNRRVLIPIARLKQEDDEIRTPYSFKHLQESPEVEAGDQLSEEDDQALRTYYAIGLADQGMVEAAQSYASQVPEEDEGPAKKADADSVEGRVRELDERDPGEAAREADEEEGGDEDEGERKGRKATADDVLEDDEEDSGGKGSDEKGTDEKDSGENKAESKDDSKDHPTDQSDKDREGNE